MRSFRKKKAEILTVKDLLKFSEEGIRMEKKQENIKYVDVSPPSEEIVDINLNSFKFWPKGTKQFYETWDY